MKKGKVYLVGAGIGDAENITIRGKKLLEKADVIVHDRLMNKELLNELKDDSILINVGKASADHLVPQEGINQILVDYAKEGKEVVRIKGGDPYVFGRGGEEAEFLLKNGVEFEIVPGLTSAVAGLCFAGIPITHRDYASSLHLITGHKKDGVESIDYKNLSKLSGTLVFYMGLKNLYNISKSLIENGKNEDTPVAVISNAGYPNQSVQVGNLENIDKLVKENKNIVSPAIIAVGDVVNLREKLNFFEKRDLFSKRIVVTRSREQSSKLKRKLLDLGADVIELPSIKIKPKNLDIIDDEIKDIKKYTHLIFTSKNSVKIFMDEFIKISDIRNLSGVKIAVVGNGTQNELFSYGIKADILPSTYIAEGLFDELKNILKSDDRVLLPISSISRDYLKDNLSKICELKSVDIYDTVIENKHDEAIEKILMRPVDFITFTSSSTVKNTIKILEDKADIILKNPNTKIISIGPITSKTIKEFGYEVDIEAKTHNIKTMIDIMIKEGKNENEKN